MNREKPSEITLTTTVVVNAELHKELKKKLIDQGITFSEWVRIKMEEELQILSFK